MDQPGATQEKEKQDPMAALREILDEAGPDVAALFGPALTIFAGARSAPIQSEVRSDLFTSPRLTFKLHQQIHQPQPSARLRKDRFRLDRNPG